MYSMYPPVIYAAPVVVTLAKAKPGQLNVGTGGAGGTTRLSAELFKLMAGIDIGRLAAVIGMGATLIVEREMLSASGPFPYTFGTLGANTCN